MCDAAGRRLGRHAVVTREHDVEPAGREAREPRERALHRREAVPREHADLETERVELVYQSLGALVGRARGSAGQLEALQGGERVVPP